MQATRMLTDPKAADAVHDFTMQWAQLQGTATEGKDSQFKLWNANPKIGEELVDETLTNVSQLVLTANGDLTTLLTSPMSYINSDLATYYGGGTALPLGSTSVTVSDPSLSSSTTTTPPLTTFTQTMIPNRMGILTNGSIQATQAHSTLPSAVLRGKIVRENVLCDVISPPPAMVPPPPTAAPDVDGGTTTTRELLDVHTTNPCAMGCHKFMDPIGFGFLNFDASGAWQSTDANGVTVANGVTNPPTFPPIDASGQINPFNPGELSATFTDLTDLLTQLSAATQTKQCFALQQLRYALSRLETADDACSAQQIYGAFTAGNLNIQKLLLAVVASDAFRYRLTVTAGNACQ